MVVRQSCAFLAAQGLGALVRRVPARVPEGAEGECERAGLGRRVRDGFGVGDESCAGWGGVGAEGRVAWEREGGGDEDGGAGEGGEEGVVGRCDRGGVAKSFGFERVCEDFVKSLC